jgi:hypothetical protein
MLYMKGGRMGKAVDMCFAGRLFDVLQHIADDLGSSGADPSTYARCVCGGEEGRAGGEGQVRAAW